MSSKLVNNKWFSPDIPEGVFEEADTAGEAIGVDSELVCVGCFGLYDELHTVPLCSKHVHCISCAVESFEVSDRLMPFTPARCNHCGPFSANSAKQILPANLARQYHEKLRQHMSKVRVWCSTPDCNTFLYENTHWETPGDETGLFRYRWATCQSCNKSTCLICRNPCPDYGHICSKSVVDLGPYTASARIKQCPNCGEGRELSEACNHFSCPCGHQFCFICLLEWQGVHDCPAYGDPVYDKEGRDARGLHVRSGLDKDGFNRYGFHENGRTRDPVRLQDPQLSGFRVWGRGTWWGNWWRRIERTLWLLYRSWEARVLALLGAYPRYLNFLQNLDCEHHFSVNPGCENPGPGTCPRCSWTSSLYHYRCAYCNVPVCKACTIGFKCANWQDEWSWHLWGLRDVLQRWEAETINTKAIYRTEVAPDAAEEGKSRKNIYSHWLDRPGATSGLKIMFGPLEERVERANPFPSLHESFGIVDMFEPFEQQLSRQDSLRTHVVLARGNRPVKFRYGNTFNMVAEESIEIGNATWFDVLVMDEEQVAQLHRFCTRRGRTQLWRPEHNYRYKDEVIHRGDAVNQVELNKALKHLNSLWRLDNDETVSLWKCDSDERMYRKALRKVEKTLDQSFVTREGLNLETWDVELEVAWSESE